jgi:small subunit ribosomal protein S16
LASYSLPAIRYPLQFDRPLSGAATEGRPWLDATPIDQENSMALKIRLRRMGRKKAPHYRIVIAESSMPRDGRFVTTIGHYNPRTEPMTLVVDRDKAQAWISKGAQPTDTVRSLLKRAGVFRELTPAEIAMEAAKRAASTAGAAATGAVAAASGAVSGAVEAVSDAAEAVADRAQEVAADVVDAAQDAAADVVEAVQDAATAATDRVSGEDDETRE